MDAHETVWVYAVNIPGEGSQSIVSVLPHEIVFRHGLLPEAVVGKLVKRADQGGTVTPGNFVQNTRFVNFLHEAIGRYGPDQPGLIAAAKQVGTGYVYVIDARTPTPQGTVPPHDVIGAFRVERGRVVPGSYERNPNHVLLSADGFFRLEKPLHERLLQELTARQSA